MVHDMYTVTVSKKSADSDGTILMEVTITSDVLTDDTARFVVSRDTEDAESTYFTNSDLISIASPGDLEEYGTVAIYPGLYRKSSILVGIPNSTKSGVFLANLLADLEDALGLSSDAPSDTVVVTEHTYQDSGDVSGPFVFAQDIEAGSSS